VAGLGLGLYARLLAATVHFELDGEQYLAAARASGRPLLLAAWHGQTHLLYPLIRGWIDPSRLVMMVVGDERAAVLRQFARTVAIPAYPVSMDDLSMSGARNLMRLIQRLRQGADSYMTPDGPDGPSRQAKAGTIFLAQRAEALLVPIGAYGRPAFHLRRWDRYALPLPFSRVTAVVRPPFVAERGTRTADLLQRLSREMNQAQELARATWEG
jgi:hypothetical protein